MSKKVCKFLIFMAGVLAVAGAVYYFLKCKKAGCCEEASSDVDDFDDFDDFDDLDSADPERNYVDLTESQEPDAVSEETKTE